jgi:hypothetical protein
MASPLSSFIKTSSLEPCDMKSSSESMSGVRGVGGAAIRAAEATALLLAGSSPVVEVIVASAAFLFLVVGGILAASGGWERAVCTRNRCDVDERA